MKRWLFWMTVITVLVALLSSVEHSAVSAMSSLDPGACTEREPVVTTDKEDYGPTETAVISGSGFGCGEALSVLVTAPDSTTYIGNGTGKPGPEAVVTDNSGNFFLYYSLSGQLPGGGSYIGQEGVYLVEVFNAEKLLVASTSFTDGHGSHECAVIDGGEARCWGWNQFGQLGPGYAGYPYLNLSVTPVGLGSGVAQMSNGSLHTCALTMGGGVKCWGLNSSGQLGDGTNTQRTSPVDVVGLTSGATQVSAGANHTCAVLTGGSVKCWGSNSSGQLGDNTLIAKNSPVNVSNLSAPVAQISSGYSHTCALLNTGDVQCWGNNAAGQLGTGTSGGSSPLPATVTSLGDVVQISAGWDVTCAVESGGAVKCWGVNYYGQLGQGTQTSFINAPVAIPISGGNAQQVSVGNGFVCALIDTGGVKCWGSNSNGQMGIGNFATPQTSPVNVISLSGTITQIHTANYHVCALNSNADLQCWGGNIDGQLGRGSRGGQAHTPSPVTILSEGVIALPDFYAPAPSGPDNDGDGDPDDTDPDDDNDGVPDINDAFPFDPTESADNDNDGIGDNADPDDDNDGVLDENDAFPFDPTESADNDNDGTGDNADPDDDNDGVLDINDAFPLDPTESADNDNDGTGDNADPDDDNDGVLDGDDAFPLDPTRAVICPPGYYGAFSCLPAQPGEFAPGGTLAAELCPFGTFSDFTGASNCQPAAAGFYVDQLGSSTETACPAGTTTTGIGSTSVGDCLTDTDGDGLPDVNDPDDDNDGVLDADDAFPTDPTESADSDNDGIGDNADPDDDNDGVLDENDAFPFDPTESADSDNDGTGDNADPDDDNDGVFDVNDLCPLEDASGLDSNGDGCADNLENLSAVISNMNLDHGLENALLAKVTNAQIALDNGDIAGAQDKLLSFINHVEAQRGKKISTGQADILIGFAQIILSQLQ